MRGGARKINGTGSYTFCLTVEDNDNRIPNSEDRIQLVVRDELDNIVYEIQSTVTIGYMTIKRS